MHDYFYGSQADQFAFYRVPKVLFTDERYKNISPEAKTLYGILLDRMNLSAKNGWLDDRGRVYIIFTTEEVMKALSCADNKATKLMNELEHKCGLIERKRQGLTKPNLIYVKNFISEQRFLNRENHDSGSPEITIQEPSESRCNNTDSNNTENNNTDLSFLSGGSEKKRRYDYQEYDSFFRERLDMDILQQEAPEDAEQLEELLQLIVDAYCSTQQRIRIGRDDKPIEIVRSQFMKLNSEHIRFVLLGMKENTTRIRNIRQYLLSALYNAPLTMSGYYSARVNHDMAPQQRDKPSWYSTNVPYEPGSSL